MTGLRASSVLICAAFFVLGATSCLTVTAPAQQTIAVDPTADVEELVLIELTRLAPTETPLPTDTPIPVLAETRESPQPAVTLDLLHSGPSIADLVEAVRPSLARIQAGNKAGSGFIYTEDGLVVTNAHVVDCCKWVSIYVENRKYGGPVLGMDQHADIAVLRIDADRHFHPVSFGSATQTTIGDEVIALGYPLSLGNELTATKGIVSSKRTLSSLQYFQHDAPVNSGNSGGPLINLDGLVIGMNSNKIKKIGVEGVAFALSIGEIDRRLAYLADESHAATRPTISPRPTSTPRSWPVPTMRPTPIPTVAPSAPTNGYVQFDLGSSHGCAVKTDNTVVCWGENHHGQASPPGGRFRKVSVGSVHSCGIKTDHSVECWGSNHKGIATPWRSIYIGQSTPPQGKAFMTLFSDRNKTCGILLDGRVDCWGGVIDLKPKEGDLKPNERKLVEYLRDQQFSASHGEFEQVDFDYETHCGIRPNKQLACWGHVGQPPPNGKFEQVSVGLYHNCAIRTDKSLVCWSTTNPETYVSSTPPAGSFTQVSVATLHTCAIRDDLRMVCWESEGRATDGTDILRYGQAIAPAGQFTQVVATRYTTCGLRTDGHIVCFGRNKYGEAAPPAP